MRAAVVDEPGAPVRIEDRERPEPGRGEVLLRVRACGVCHSDVNVRDGHVPDTDFPVVPGHEVVGEVVERGAGVEAPAVGERVGVPWLYAACGRCDRCVEGEGILCPEMEVTGATRDGGYAEFMVAAADYVTPVPEALGDVEAAPLMCAGITVFQGLRNAGFEPGDRVAVLGLGGLGHLGVRYADAMGGRVTVLSTSPGKERDARRLGADRFVRLDAGDPAEALQEEGGADVVLGTAPSSSAMSALVPGLAADGTLVVLGIEDAVVEAHPMDLIMGRRRVMGSPSGSRKDLRACLEFSARHGVTARVEETFPLEEAGAALEAVESGRLPGRAVLATE